MAAKQGATFTIMVCGESGLGKTTFINTLFHSNIKPHLAPEDRHSTLLLPQQTVDIGIVRAQLEEKNFSIRLNVIDTPGFGTRVNNTDLWQAIVDFIDDQHDAFLKQERQPMRLNKVDLRVHACLYFIRPTGHSLKPLDIETMKRLLSRVNLIPVIAKADTLAPAELLQFKQRIREVIEAQDIAIYVPPLDAEDAASAEHAKQLIEVMPFAVVGLETPIEVEMEDGLRQEVRARRYHWGVVEVENEDHCDFKKLRSLLLRTNMLDLILSLQETHFETYRRLQMDVEDPELSTAAAGGDDSAAGTTRAPKKSRRAHNPKFKEEEDALKRFFTAQVKAEELRFRQWESNIVNERNRLNTDLEEMQAKVKALEEDVKRLQVR